jgi:hypothetical protein
LDVPTILSITQERALTTEGITLSTPSTYSFKTHPLVAAAEQSSSNNSSSNGHTQEHPDPAAAAPAVVKLFCAAVAGDNA